MASTSQTTALPWQNLSTIFRGLPEQKNQVARFESTFEHAITRIEFDKQGFMHFLEYLEREMRKDATKISEFISDLNIYESVQHDIARMERHWDEYDYESDDDGAICPICEEEGWR